VSDWSTALRTVPLLLLAACYKKVPEGDVCETAVSVASPAMTIEQIGLTEGLLGESALVIGPDGTSVLIDVGWGHKDDILTAAERSGLGDTVDWVILTHDDPDHVGSYDNLFTKRNAPLTLTNEVVRWDTPTLPVTIELGGGAQLVLFVADGRLATSAGEVNLFDEFDKLDRLDNTHSVAGIITYGEFSYVFGGDMPGGGKTTPDMEGAIAGHAADIPWVPPDGVTMVHVNHHGISTSTNEAWTDWLKPRFALLGATNVYLDVPSEEALASLEPHVEAVWITETGKFGNENDQTCVAHGSVVVQVGEGGDDVGVELIPVRD